MKQYVGVLADPNNNVDSGGADDVDDDAEQLPFRQMNEELATTAKSSRR